MNEIDEDIKDENQNENQNEIDNKNKSDNEQKRKIQLNLINMQFDLIMINKIFENYEIEDEEQAINYLIPIDGVWMHPFIPKKLDDPNRIDPYNINERLKNSINNIIIKIRPNSKCEICNEPITNHIDHGNYEIKSKSSSLNKSNNENNNEQNNNNIDNNNNEENKSNELCGICMGEIDDPIIIPNCNHKFCHDCFLDYLINKINTNDIETISCPNYLCNNKKLEENFFLNLLSEEILFKYQTFKSQNQIRKSPNKISCPFCNSYAEIEKKKKNDNNSNNLSDSMISLPKQNVLCIENKHEFCSCGRPLHSGKCTDDSIKEYMKSKNIKKCPKCLAFIKKDSGCNHMTCPICHYEFCWLCLKESLPNHYEFGSCAGMQFIDENSFIYRFRNTHPFIVSLIKIFLNFLTVLLFISLIISPLSFVCFFFYFYIYVEPTNDLNIILENDNLKNLFLITCWIWAICYFTVYNLIYVSIFVFIGFIFLIVKICGYCYYIFDRNINNRYNHEGNLNNNLIHGSFSRNQDIVDDFDDLFD
jgi:hypothetical protein